MAVAEGVVKCVVKCYFGTFLILRRRSSCINHTANESRVSEPAAQKQGGGGGDAVCGECGESVIVCWR